MISVRNLSMTYRSAHGEHAALRNVSLEVKQGEFFTLLGPSGCGKTSTLRCIAGLEQPDSGDILIDGEAVYSSARNISVPPHQRNIGMVFQSYAIWPHMTVFDNVAFPLHHKQPRPSRAEIRERAMRALELVQLSGLEKRPAPFLSGGQQQRLALARALISEPRVLLLDEPLSNLDAKLREEMRYELRQVVERLGVTTLFVTHEQVEALTMSDVIAVMKDGTIVQEGSPTEIYQNPTAAFVADFIGRTNFLAGQVSALEPGDGRPRARVETAIGAILCQTSTNVLVGDEVVIGIRPENVTVYSGDAETEGNVFVANVDSLVYVGNLLECAMSVGPARIKVQLHPSTRVGCGDTVRVTLPAEHCLAMHK
jgi:iron(III) transport system ATP-binding protein